MLPVEVPWDPANCSRRRADLVGSPWGSAWGTWAETGGGVSTKPSRLSGLDPKPGELPMARLKLR